MTARNGVESIHAVLRAWNESKGTMAVAAPAIADQLLPCEEAINDHACCFIRGYQQGPQAFAPILTKLGQRNGDLLFAALNPTTRLRLETVKWFADFELGRESTLNALLVKYREALHSAIWDCVDNTRGKQTQKSAAALRLKANLLETLDKSVHKLETTYRDPAVAFLADTLLELSGESLDDSKPDAELNQWSAGHAWVLTTLESDKLNEEPLPPGLLLRLRIEKRGDGQGSGCGAIYPHPNLAAHLDMTPLFAAGIRNAWGVIMAGEEKSKAQLYDYRWSFTVVEPNGQEGQLKQWLIRSKLDGDSASLSFALALNSIVKNQRLRKDRAATACFSDAKDSHNHYGWGDVQDNANPSLHAVAGIPKKEQVIQATYQKAGITALVTATDQTADVPIDIHSEFPACFGPAYMVMSEFEKWIEKHADLVATNLADQCKPEEDERLDLFVWPQLEWEVEKKKASEIHNEDERWEQSPVTGEKEQQLETIFQQLTKRGKFLVVHDGAGAGKTALSLQLEHHASDKNKFATLFADGRRRLVIRWEKQLPLANLAGNPSLTDLVAADPRLKNVVSDVTDRRSLIEYVIKEGLLVLIIDGYDEFTDEHRIVLRQYFDETDNGVHTRARDARHVQWIILGRPHTINAERALFVRRHRWLQDKHFVRLRIRLFDEQRQDHYFSLALRSLPRGRWRQMIEDLSEGDRAEIVGLPHTLREVFRFLEDHLRVHPKTDSLPKFVSLSDLFLKTSGPLLRRCLEKVTGAQLTCDTGISSDFEQRFVYLERALSCIACEMAVQGMYRATIPKAGENPLDCVTRVKVQAFSRFERISKAADPTLEYQAVWNWACERLKTIALSYFSADNTNDTCCLAFRNRRVLENYVSRFLTCYHDPKDLDGTDAGLPKPVVDHIGNLEWRQIWKWTYQTPIRQDGAELTHYKAAVQLLFRKPTDTHQRRPTELMWEADQWIKKQVKAGQTVLNGFAKELREFLGGQFRAKSGSDVAKDLVDSKNYVFMGGAFMMGDEEKVPVTLSLFGVSKYAVSNAQFQLFDNDFAEETQDDKKRFGGDDQPAVFVSWHDSYWFAEFLDFGAHVTREGKKWRFDMLTEAQWEFAARAGGKGKYFLNQSGVEVTEKNLAEYAHFGQDWETGKTIAVRDDKKKPNAFGIYQTSGNVWEWVLDLYADLKGKQDPVNKEKGSNRVLRGGGWYNEAADCESADRDGNDPADRGGDLGLRLALSPSGIPKPSETGKQG